MKETSDQQGGRSSHSLADMAQIALARDSALPLVEFEKRWYTYGDVRQLTEQLKALIAASGAEPQAAVTFAARNRPSSLAALLGLIAEARPVHMLYAFQSGAAIARDLARLQPAVFLASPEDVGPEVRNIARTHGIAIITLEGMTATALPGFERATSTAAPQQPPQQSQQGTGQDPAQNAVASPPRIHVLTSGTTGAPKQFPIDYEVIANYVRQGTVMFASHGADVTKMPPVLLFFPLGNITGIYSTVPSLVMGLRVVLLDRFSLDAWRDHIRRFRPAQTGLPPSCIQMILDANVPPDELASIKSLGTGAAPLDPAVQRAFEERYKIPILLSYGATEFGGRVSAMTADLHATWGETKFGSVGRPVPGADLRIVDPESGAVLPAGKEGVLEVISPHLAPEWIRTTDLGVIDADGFLFLRGRADGAITRGGFKVLPETVERALARHPAIAEVAVVGVPNRRLGQIPAAAIRLRPGVAPPSIAELEAHLREHVLATHLPGHWRFVEELPRTQSLKVHRPSVRALFEP